MRKSWSNTIVRERLHTERILRDNPGLTPRRDELFKAAYADARKETSSESGLALGTFPERPPFALAQITAEDYRAEPDRGS